MRLLVPFIAGILIQWYLQWPVVVCIMLLLCFAVVSGVFYLLSLSAKFRFQTVQGMLLNGLLLSIALIVTWQKDNRNKPDWYGKSYREGDMILLRLEEPLVAKEKSLKVNGAVEAIFRDNAMIPCQGKILIYFSRDTTDTSRIAEGLGYGDKIITRKNLQPIKNSGNPGAFNYERYAAFQGVFHNVFLREKDWVPTPLKRINPLQQFIFSGREKILSILRNSVKGKDELGIAQALLIGYTNDLDKDLVQAYSNTGVVHIIAISGMHLGLIYVLLVWVFGKVPILNRSPLLQVIMILGCLWLFSLLTGASASVVRAAVMFTFITVGSSFKRQSSIYNSLAASAFVMLCYNPYFIWDVGFQLSYLAVTGIILFQKPVYNWFYIKNKWLDKTWQLAAVSLAAQVLTFPVCIYYFHQFPNLFLFTNIVAVPLSSLILYTEIALVTLASVPVIGFYLGKLVAGLVFVMNSIILWMNQFSFAVWDKIPATLFTTFLLYAIVISASTWLLYKNKMFLKVSLYFLLFFTGVHGYIKWNIVHQRKLVVYNVSRHRAIDFVSGNNYHFLGDSILLQEGMLQNFNLKPGRIAMQLLNATDTVTNLVTTQSFFLFNRYKILVIDKAIYFDSATQKVPLDMILLSHNPKITIAQLAAGFNCRLYVFDASNSLWKIDQWRKECEELHLRSYSVPEKGALVVDLK